MNKSTSKKYSRLANIASLSLLASSLLIGTSTLAANDANRERVITLHAQASKTIANDEMYATLYFNEEHNNPTELAARMAKTMNAAMVTVKAYPAVKVSTGGQHTYPRYNKNSKISGWQARAEIELNSQNFEQMSKLIAQLQENNLKMGNINFRVSDSAREQAENELLVEASKKFQARAGALLGVWQAGSYNLIDLELNTTNKFQAPVMYARAESTMKVADVSEQDYARGETKIIMTASGSVQLK